uniref:Uncharacterized protein n=1 Tax=Ciona savignyi TaxID=51511 RepID=H2YUE6_CIOSA
MTRKCLIFCWAIFLTMALFSKNSEQEVFPENNYAVVPYNTEGVLSKFYEHSKSVNISKLGIRFKIAQTWQKNGIAGVVWEAADVLANFMVEKYDFHGKKVLELGSGTGLVGMVAAYMGAHVTLTDLDKFLPILEENIELNMNLIKTGSKNGTVKVSELKWGEKLAKFDPTYDFVLGADIIYSEDLFPALLDTLCYFHGGGSKIILGSKLRYDRVEVFILKLNQKFRTVKEVMRCEKTQVVIYECS